MAGPIASQSGGEIPRHRAEIDVVWAMTADGLPWPVPATVADLFIARGLNELQPPKLYLRPSPPATEEPEGLTVTQAARQHLIDLPPAVDAEDAERQFIAAKVKISRACKAEHIRTITVNGVRRIEPGSFAEWRIQQREKLLREDGM